MNLKDWEDVSALLGREPRCGFEVVVRNAAGAPRVIRNDPLLYDGTPMPTRYWLVDHEDCLQVARLESEGGVKQAEAAVDAQALALAHTRYAADRDAALPSGYDGLRPSGGVGGCRKGVKCLHAHYAWLLAGGDDPVGKWMLTKLEEDTTRLRESQPDVFAAIDCGTHSTRLLIATAEGKELKRSITITNLGEGLADSGVLLEPAMLRTQECLADYKQAMKDYQVGDFRIVATSAARDAHNRDEFFARIADVMDRPPRLLSGEEEARTAFAGAISALDTEEGPYLVCDIGGGSTEFAYGSQQCEAVFSADMGSSRLTQQFIQHDPALPEELSACISVVQLHLDDLVGAVPAAADAKQLVGLAGTVTTAAAVELGLIDYDPEIVHHFRLTKAAAEDVFRTLATEDREQRLSNPGLHPGRADVIVGGLCILVKVMRYLDFEECLVSEADLLDGLVAGLIAEMRQKRETSP